jgi:hypothetical protein
VDFWNVRGGVLGVVIDQHGLEAEGPGSGDILDWIVAHVQRFVRLDARACERAHEDLRLGLLCALAR